MVARAEIFQLGNAEAREEGQRGETGVEIIGRNCGRKGLKCMCRRCLELKHREYTGTDHKRAM